MVAKTLENSRNDNGFHFSKVAIQEGFEDFRNENDCHSLTFCYDLILGKSCV